MAEESNKPSPPTPMGFCWVEVPVKDMARALKFYNEAFGWTASTEMDVGDWYIILSNPYKNLNGALRKVRGEEEHVVGTDKNHGVKAFIGLENINESLELIKKAGGEVIIPGTAIPSDGGFYAEFYDSERNVMGIWATKL
ncbi:hypothetical protein ABW19_dt0210433 [Dactylella cylindrospora]|nr:hypothetical protein ABW19_dt0210433 [Dactylella cylindrospora]